MEHQQHSRRQLKSTSSTSSITSTTSKISPSQRFIANNPTLQKRLQVHFNDLVQSYRQDQIDRLLLLDHLALLFGDEIAIIHANRIDQIPIERIPPLALDFNIENILNTTYDLKLLIQPLPEEQLDKLNQKQQQPQIHRRQSPVVPSESTDEVIYQKTVQSPQTPRQPSPRQPSPRDQSPRQPSPSSSPPLSQSSQDVVIISQKRSHSPPITTTPTPSTPSLMEQLLQNDEVEVESPVDIDQDPIIVEQPKSKKQKVVTVVLTEYQQLHYSKLNDKDKNYFLQQVQIQHQDEQNRLQLIATIDLEELESRTRIDMINVVKILGIQDLSRARRSDLYEAVRNYIITERKKNSFQTDSGDDDNAKIVPTSVHKYNIPNVNNNKNNNNGKNNSFSYKDSNAPLKNKNKNNKNKNNQNNNNSQIETSNNNNQNNNQIESNCNNQNNNNQIEPNDLIGISNFINQSIINSHNFNQNLTIYQNSLNFINSNDPSYFNNGNLDINKIDLNQLKRQGRNEILKVAGILGVKIRPASTTHLDSTIDIYNRIESFIIGSRENLLLQNGGKQRRFDTIGNSCYDIAIKDVEQTELLFWRVFRNKIICEEIYSNLKTENGCSRYGIGKVYYNYDEIVHASWLLDNKHFGLLKDKIKNCQILVSGNYKNEFGMNHSMFRQIIKVMYVNEDEDNEEEGTKFYQILFSNYQRYLECPISSLAEFSIECKNMIALQIMVDQLGYIPTHYSLDLAIQFGFLKGVKFLCNSLQQQYEHALENPNPSQIVRKISVSACKQFVDLKTTSNQMYDIMLYLVETGLISTEYPIENDNWYNVLLSITLSQRLESFDWMQLYTLQDLFNFCKLLIMFKKPLEFGVEEFYSTKAKFTRIELSLTLKQMLIMLTDPTCSMLECFDNFKKLLSLFLSVFKKSVSTYTSLIDCIVNNGNQDTFITIPSITIEAENNLEISLKFGCWAYWKQMSIEYGNGSTNIFQGFFKENIKDFKNQEILFKYCKDDRSRQLEFINELTHYISTLEFQDCKIYSFILLYLAIGFDDLDLVKIIVRELGSSVDFCNLETLTTIPSVSTILPFGSFFIQNFIKSTLMLEYCFGNFKNLFDSKHIYFYRFTSVELLNRYEQLLDEDHEEIKLTPLEALISLTTGSGSGSKENKFYYLNYNEFNNNALVFSQFLKMVKAIIVGGVHKLAVGIIDLIKGIPLEGYTTELFNQHILPDIKFIIQEKCQDLMDFNPLVMFKSNYQRERLLGWVESFSLDSVIRKKCLFKFNQPMVFDFSSIGQYGDIVLLDQYIQKELMEYPINYSEFGPQLLKILLDSANYGRLNIIQHLYYNYPHLLLKQQNTISSESKNVGGLFGYIELNSIMKIAIANGHLHIMDFLVHKMGCIVYKNDSIRYLSDYPMIGNINQNNNDYNHEHLLNKYKNKYF